MTIRNVIVAILLGLCFVAGVSWAQSGKERSPIKLPGGEGRYAVTMSGESAIMVESTTGTTWILARAPNRMWLPLDRINNYEEAEEWRKQRDEEARKSTEQFNEKSRIESEQRENERNERKRQIEELRRKQELQNKKSPE